MEIHVEHVICLVLFKNGWSCSLYVFLFVCFFFSRMVNSSLHTLSMIGLPWYSYPSQCHSSCLKLTDQIKESYECLLIRGRVGWVMAYLSIVDGKLVIHTSLPWTTHVSVVKHTVLFKIFLWFCSCKFWFDKPPDNKDPVYTDSTYREIQSLTDLPVMETYMDYCCLVEWLSQSDYHLHQV